MDTKRSSFVCFIVNIVFIVLIVIAEGPFLPK